MPNARMTLAQLEQTAWAREFKVNSPDSYREAVHLATQGGLLVNLLDGPQAHAQSS